MSVYGPVDAIAEFTVAPQLESWELAGSPSQRRLAAYLAESEHLLAAAVRDAPEPVGLRLKVALSAGVDLLHERDLDTTCFPSPATCRGPPAGR